MNKTQHLILLTLLFFSVSLFSLECPKNLAVTIDSPKAKSEVIGAKQKVSIKSNSKDNLYYHLVQTNQEDKKKTIYLQSSGKLDSNNVSNYVWLGNDKQGMNNSFLISVIVSTELVKKEGKVVTWNDKSLKPNTICGTNSVEVKRTN